MGARFLTRDPLEALTRSAYGYAGNNPINGTDPTGLCWGPTCIVEDVVEATGNFVDDHRQGIINGAGGLLNGITLGHGEEILSATGRGGNVDWDSGAAQAFGVLGVALDVPLLVPTVARGVGLTGARWGVTALSVHRMAATTSLFVGGFDAYTKNTPAGYGLFMGGGLPYLGVPGAGFVDAYFALKGLFDC